MVPWCYVSEVWVAWLLLRVMMVLMVLVVGGRNSKGWCGDTVPSWLVMIQLCGLLATELVMIRLWCGLPVSPLCLSLWPPGKLGLSHHIVGITA